MQVVSQRKHLTVCYRCGVTIPADRFDLEQWIVVYTWEDGYALCFCDGCQTPAESTRSGRANN